MVVMGVIDRQTVHGRQIQLADPPSEDDVPHPLRARMGRVPLVVRGWMPIVDLEKALPLHLHQVFSGDPPSKIRMVDVREHGLAGLAALIQNGVHPALHHIEHIGATLRRDLLAEIGGVDVHRKRQVTAGDFLGGNHQEPTGFFEQAAELRQRLQPILVGAVMITSHQPVGPKAALVLLEGLGKMVLCGLGDPLLALQHPVVIGQREKVVTVFLVPVGDGLGEIIAITPEGMRVEVALPPPGLGGRRPANHPKHGHD